MALPGMAALTVALIYMAYQSEEQETGPTRFILFLFCVFQRGCRAWVCRYGHNTALKMLDENPKPNPPHEP